MEMHEKIVYDIFRNNIYVSKVDEIIDECMEKLSYLNSLSPSRTRVFEALAHSIGKNLFLHSKSNEDLIKTLLGTIGTMIKSMDDIATSKGYEPLDLEIQLTVGGCAAKFEGL